MSELSMHELEAQTGEVLPEREALATFVYAPHSRFTQINNTSNHITSTTISASNTSSALSTGFASSATSSAGQSIYVHG